MMILKKHKIIPFLFFLLLVGFPFFFWGGPQYNSCRSLKSFWDLGHVVYFGIFSYILHSYYLGKKPNATATRGFCFVFCVVFVAGLAVEVAQMGMRGDRSADIFDLLRDLLGCILTYIFVIMPILHKRRLQAVIRVLAIGLLAIALWPITEDLIDEYIAMRQFPVLSDFETPFEKYRWEDVRRLREERGIVRHGAKSARVQLTTEKYSGISLFYFPKDWRGYNQLHFSLNNPTAHEVEIHYRIHDSSHKKNGNAYDDRFNQKSALKPGWNDLTVSMEEVRKSPKGRMMDLGSIEGFGFFVVEQDVPQTLFLDNVYLSK